MKPQTIVGEVGSERAFPIVAIGASAGGLHSLQCFLSALPEQFNFALVFMQHLSPSHKNLLPDLLRSHNRQIEIEEIADGLKVEPGKLFLCPPAKKTGIRNGLFSVTRLPKEYSHLPIDELFISLAEEAKDRAVAVVFSGAGTDGARGIQAIRAQNGSVLVQEPSTAEFSGMPQAAINTGQVDAVLTPHEIALEILKLCGSDATLAGVYNIITPDDYESFYRLIHKKTGCRFSYYKKSVVGRRIGRRMNLLGISSMQDYMRLILDKDAEAGMIASDLLIGVTSFFRDRPAWKALTIEVVRKLTAEDSRAVIRVWTPACSTGEEPYSIAMLLLHELELSGKRREIQVFATDVNDRALDKAREGTYPVSIAADLPSEYLQKYFTTADDEISVVINKEVRERVVFAKQDLLNDPPFSKLDLVICRNLLIYLEPLAQDKCISLFHYALRDSGALFLGNAESPGSNAALFRPAGHKKCRIYRKSGMSQTTRLPLSAPYPAERLAPISGKPISAGEARQMVADLAQESLLEEFAPAAIAIDQNYEILYHNGPTNQYLKQPRGTPTQNLMELVPEDLRNKVRGGLYRAARDSKPISLNVGFVEDDRQKRKVILRISKLRDNLFLILFQEKKSFDADDSVSLKCDSLDENVVRQLETELAATKQDLQSNIEQLRGLNEELHSSNEELQAANEELETSREELQSLNEELVTVNSQLQLKIEEQEETNDDLSNFLTSTSIPTVFLDQALRVKRFTPAMSKLVQLLPSDVGRPISDLSQENLGAALITDVRSVLESLVPIKKEIAIGGTVYTRTTLPYRTLDDRIEGVVITYSDITDLKQVQDKLSFAKEEWERTFDSVPDLITILDNEHRVRRVNKAMAQRLGLTPEKCIGLHCYEAIHGLSAPPAFCPHSRTMADSCEHIEEVHEDRLGGDFIVSASPLYDHHGRMTGSVHVAHDITKRKQAEETTKHMASYPKLNPNAILETDLAGNIIFLNPSTEKILRELGMPEAATAFLPSDLDTIIHNWDSKTESTFYREIIIMDRVFGETVHLIPQFKSVRIYATDITERSRAEKALRESEQHLSTVFRASPTGIFVTRLSDGLFLDANEAYLQIMGYSADEVIGYASLDLNIWANPEDRERMVDLLREHGRIESRETRLRRKNGEIIDLLYSALPLERGGERCILGTLTDITERKRVEKLIVQHLEELRASNEELERFNAAAVGREMRMVELKKEINEFCIRVGLPPRYPLDFGEDLS